MTDASARHGKALPPVFLATWTRGTTKTVAGREVLSEEAFRVVVEEIVPGVPRELLQSSTGNAEEA